MLCHALRIMLTSRSPHTAPSRVISSTMAERIPLGCRCNTIDNPAWRLLIYARLSTGLA